LASMKMKAVRDGDDYIINGQKTFNTECHYSDYHWLAVRTDSDPEKAPYKGISLFIVDQNAPGIDIRPMMCMSGEQTNEVYYEDVRVPASRRVGEENKGFYYVMEALGSERNQVFVPSRLRPILDIIISYAKGTEYNGKPLAEDPVIRAEIAQLGMEIEVADMLASNSRWLELTEQKMTHEPELCKVFTSELQQRIANVGMDILGHFSQLEEDTKYAPEKGRIEWHWLHSFVCTLGGGTSEIGRNIIATRGLGLPR
jgi:alkylation response protein AidB-like acyl-CoA dehydrogenase